MNTTHVNKDGCLSDEFKQEFEWIRMIQSGDSEIFALLFRKYYEQLYRFAGRYLKDPQTSESVVQDVFVKIWSNREKLHIQSNVKSYLYTAVRNHALNHIKHQKFTLDATEEFHFNSRTVPSPEDELIDKELGQAVQKAIDRLPKQCKQIYLMKRYDDLSYAEISEILNISINTVKTQMKRAFKSLRNSLSYLLGLIVFLFTGG